MRRIMIDMDDVIVGGGFLYLINEYLKTDYKEDDFKDFYMQDIIPDKESFFKFFLTRNMYEHCFIYPNAYEVIEKLSKVYKIYIGTSYIYREVLKESGIILLHKYNFLVEKFPFLTPTNFVFLVDKSVLNCEIKIDDCIDNLDGATTKILFSAYHNNKISEEDLTKRGVVRVKDWLDIEKILLSDMKSDMKSDVKSDV